MQSRKWFFGPSPVQSAAARGAGEVVYDDILNTYTEDFQAHVESSEIATHADWSRDSGWAASFANNLIIIDDGGGNLIARRQNAHNGGSRARWSGVGVFGAGVLDLYIQTRINNGQQSHGFYLMNEAGDAGFYIFVVNIAGTVGWTFGSYGAGDDYAVTWGTPNNNAKYWYRLHVNFDTKFIGCKVWQDADENIDDEPEAWTQSSTRTAIASWVNPVLHASHDSYNPTHSKWNYLILNNTFTNLGYLPEGWSGAHADSFKADIEIDALPQSDVDEIQLSRVDSDNLFKVQIYPNGSWKLVERVAGIENVLFNEPSGELAAGSDLRITRTSNEAWGHVDTVQTAYVNTCTLLAGKSAIVMDIDDGLKIGGITFGTP